MRWSKLRRLITDRFAAPLQGRLDIHSAAYGNCSCGHAWLTLDGDVIANFCTRAHANAEYVLPQGAGNLNFTPAANTMYRGQLASYGELSRQQVYRTMWDFVHTISVEDALESDDMLMRALAVADARVGKRRLAQLDPEALHPLCGYLLLVRRGETGVSPADYARRRYASEGSPPGSASNKDVAVAPATYAVTAESRIVAMTVETGGRP